MANTELIRIASLGDAERKIITAFLSTQERKEALLEAAKKQQKENDLILKKEENRTWRHERVGAELITAIDLQEEMRQYNGAIETFHVFIGDNPEAAQVLYLPYEHRMGIAWGSDATWADVEGFLIGVEMYVNDGKTWIARN